MLRRFTTDKDLRDVGHMLRAGWVEPDELRRFFAEIEPLLYRYPAIDPPTFRRAVDEFLGPASSR